MVTIRKLEIERIKKFAYKDGETTGHHLGVLDERRRILGEIDHYLSAIYYDVLPGIPYEEYKFLEEHIKEIKNIIKKSGGDE